MNQDLNLLKVNDHQAIQAYKVTTTRIIREEIGK